MKSKSIKWIIVLTFLVEISSCVAEKRETQNIQTIENDIFELITDDILLDESFSDKINLDSKNEENVFPQELILWLDKIQNTNIDVELDDFELVGTEINEFYKEPFIQFDLTSLEHNDYFAVSENYSALYSDVGDDTSLLYFFDKNNNRIFHEVIYFNEFVLGIQWRTNNELIVFGFNSLSFSKNGSSQMIIICKIDDKNKTYEIQRYEGINIYEWKNIRSLISYSIENEK